jgi:hypothetical protein
MDFLTMFNKTMPMYHELHSALEICLHCCGLKQLDMAHAEKLISKVIWGVSQNHSQSHIRAYMVGM